MSDNGWTFALATDDLPNDDVFGVVVAGRDIAISTIGDAVFATDNICTHGRARLSDGFLDGHEIECPLHQGKFDVRSGAATCAPAVDALRTYPIKIDGTGVYIRID